MSQVTQTTTTTITTPHVTLVYTRAMLITKMVILAATSVDQMISGQHDMVLLPQLIMMDTIRSFVGLTTKPQQ